MSGMYVEMKSMLDFVVPALQQHSWDRWIYGLTNALAVLQEKQN